MHVSYYQSLDIVFIHIKQFQHLNFDYQKLKKKITSESLRVHYVTKKIKKKWWEPQYLANPPNLILSWVTHSLKNFSSFLFRFPNFLNGIISTHR